MAARQLIFSLPTGYKVISLELAIPQLYELLRRYDFLRLFINVVVQSACYENKSTPVDPGRAYHFIFCSLFQENVYLQCI